MVQNSSWGEGWYRFFSFQMPLEHLIMAGSFTDDFHMTSLETRKNVKSSSRNTKVEFNNIELKVSPPFFTLLKRTSRMTTFYWCNNRTVFERISVSVSKCYRKEPE